MPYKDKEKEKQNKHDRYEQRKQDPEFLAKRQKYRDENAERNREYQRIYRMENADQLAELKARRQHLWKSSQKEYSHEYQRQYAARHRQAVLRAYGGKCVCCGETRQEFLNIDHANESGADHRKFGCGKGHPFYRWLVNNGCPPEYRLLCCNCNFSRGRYGYCPHDREKSSPTKSNE